MTMKRSLSIIIAVALGLTLAPVGATAMPSASPATGSVALASDSSPQERATVEVDSKKKKCTYMCVQSTLPTIQFDGFFVNGNRHLVSVNDEGYSRRNLDTRKVAGSQIYDGGILTTAAAVSSDDSTLLIAGTNDSVDFGTLHFLTVDTETLVPPTEIPRDTTTTVALTSQNLLSMAVSPDNSGWFMVLRDFNEYVPYLCRFNALGEEVGCSESFLAGSLVSPIFFDSSGESAYVVSASTLYKFNLSTLAVTSMSLGGIEIDTNGVMAPDDNMYFYSSIGPFDPVGDTSIYRVTTSGIVTMVGQISGAVMISDIVAPMNDYGVLYVLGRPKKANGAPQNYSLVFGFDYANESFISKVVRIKPTRGNHPNSLVIDRYGRYLLAFSGTGPTSVIPVGRTGPSKIVTTATVGDGGWQIDWDYINLAPGAKLKKYQLWYQAPNTSKWRKSSQFRAGRDHTTFFTAGVPRGLVKVLPVGIHASDYNWADLPGQCTIHRVGTPQPAC